MADSVLIHQLTGERSRLALMSQLLDPPQRQLIEARGIGPGARTLELRQGDIVAGPVEPGSLGDVGGVADYW